MALSPQQLLEANNRRLYADMVYAIQQFLNFQQQRDADLAKFAAEYELQQRDESDNTADYQTQPQEERIEESDEPNQLEEFLQTMLARFARATTAIQVQLLKAIAQAVQNNQMSTATAAQMRHVVNNVLKPQVLMPKVQQRFARMTTPTSSIPSAPTLDDDAIQAMAPQYRDQATTLRKQIVPSAPVLEQAASITKSVVHDALAVESTRVAPKGEGRSAYLNESARFFKSPQFNNQLLIQQLTEAFRPVFEHYARNRNGLSPYVTPVPLFNTCRADFEERLRRQGIESEGLSVDFRFTN
jgi:hypothetical protein